MPYGRHRALTYSIVQPPVWYAPAVRAPAHAAHHCMSLTGVSLEHRTRCGTLMLYPSPLPCFTGRRNLQVGNLASCSPCSFLCFAGRGRGQHAVVAGRDGGDRVQGALEGGRQGADPGKDSATIEDSVTMEDPYLTACQAHEHARKTYSSRVLAGHWHAVRNAGNPASVGMAPDCTWRGR